MADLEKLVVRLEAETARFQRGMEQAQRQLAKFDKRASVTAKSIAGLQKAFIGLGGAAAGYKLAALTKATFDYADATAEAAQSLGLSIESYQKLSFAASQAGINQDKFTASFSRFVQFAQEAQAGGGPAKFFERLGIDAKTAGADIEATFRLVVERLDEIPTQSERLKLIGDAFGSKTAAAWAATFSQGADGLRAMGDEAERLGLVLTKAEAEGLGMMADSVDRLGAKLKVAFARGLASGFVDEAGKMRDIFSDPQFMAGVDAVASGFSAMGRATGELVRLVGQLAPYRELITLIAGAGAGAYMGRKGGRLGMAMGAARGLAAASTVNGLVGIAGADPQYYQDAQFGPFQPKSDTTASAQAAGAEIAASIDRTAAAAASAAPVVERLVEAYDFQSEAAEDAADWERELGYIYAQNEAAILGVTQEVLAYDQAIADLNLLLENGVISHEQYERAAKKAAEGLDTYSNAVRRFRLNLREDVKQSTSNLFQNLITDGADWKDHLLNYFSQIGDAFARMASDMAAQALFGTTGGSSGSGINWGQLAGNLVGSLIGGASGSGGVAAIGTRGTGGPVLLASGGPLSAGQPAIIGEEGPELVLPRHAAQVFNADDTRSMLGGARVSQTFNIVAPDPNAFRGSERQIMRRSRAALGIA